MPDFVIRSEYDEKWNVLLGDCTREHAESVLEQLEADPTTRAGLTLEELEPGAAQEPSGILSKLLGRH